MKRYELEAWLGPAKDQMSTREVDDFAALVAKIEDRYGDAIETTHAMSGALQVMLRDDTLEGLAGAWKRAREAEREAMAILTGAMIATDAAGTTQAEIATRAGVTRPTVAKALGR